MSKAAKPSSEPLGIYAKGNSAPYLRIVLDDASQLLLQYIHIHLMELSPDGTLLCLHSPDSVIQVEGQGLGALLLNLQTCSVNWMEKGQGDPVSITRIVRIEANPPCE